MPRALSAEKKAEIEELFELYDENAEGSIPSGNLATILRAMDFNPSTEYLDKQSAKFAAAGFNNKITLSDLMTICEDETLSAEGPSDEDLKKAFAAFDLDGNGTINTTELSKALQTMGEKMSENEVGKMFGKLDKDSDGKLDYDEFLTVLVPATTAAQAAEKNKEDAAPATAGGDSKDSSNVNSTNDDTAAKTNAKKDEEPAKKEEKKEPKSAAAPVAVKEEAAVLGEVKTMAVNTADVKVPKEHIFADSAKSLQVYGRERRPVVRNTTKTGSGEGFDRSTSLVEALRVGREDQVGATIKLKCHLSALSENLGSITGSAELAESPVLRRGVAGKNTCASSTCFPGCLGTTLAQQDKEDRMSFVSIYQSYIDLVPPVNAEAAAFDADVASLKQGWSEEGKKKNRHAQAVFLENLPTSNWRDFMDVCLSTSAPDSTLSVGDDEKLQGIVGCFGACDSLYREESSGLTPLAFAVSLGGSPALLKKLLCKDSLILHPFSPSESPLHIACARGTVDQVQALMGEGRSLLLLVRSFCYGFSPWEVAIARHGAANGGPAAREAILSWIVPLLAVSKSAVDVQSFELFAAKHNAGVVGLPKVWASVAAQCAAPTNKFDGLGGLVGTVAAMPPSEKQIALLDALLENSTIEDLESDRTWQGGSILHTLVCTNNAHGVSAVLAKAPSLMLAVDRNSRIPLSLALYRKKSADNSMVKLLLAPSLAAVKAHRSALDNFAVLPQLFTALVSKKMFTEAEEVGLGSLGAAMPSTKPDWLVPECLALDLADTLGAFVTQASTVKLLISSIEACDNGALKSRFVKALLYSANHHGNVALAMPLLEKLDGESDILPELFKAIKAENTGDAIIKALWSKLVESNLDDTLMSLLMASGVPGLRLIHILRDKFTTESKFRWGACVLRETRGTGEDGFGGYKKTFGEVLTTTQRYKLLQHEAHRPYCDAFDALVKSGAAIPGEVAVSVMGSSPIFGMLGTHGLYGSHGFTGKHNRITFDERKERVARFLQLVAKNCTPSDLGLMTEAESKKKQAAKPPQDSDDDDDDGGDDDLRMEVKFIQAAPFHLMIPVLRDGWTSKELSLKQYAENHIPPTDQEFTEKGESFVLEYLAFLKQVGMTLKKPRSTVGMLCHISQLLTSGTGNVNMAISAIAASSKPQGRLLDYQILLLAMASCGAASRTWRLPGEDEDDEGKNADEDDDYEGEEEEEDEKKARLDREKDWPKVTSQEEKTLYPLLLAQRLVEMNATENIMTHFLTIFPQGIPVVAATASKMSRPDLMELALASAKSKNVNCSILPATNLAIDSIAKHSSSDSIGFVPTCGYLKPTSRSNQYQTVQHGITSLSMALMSRYVDAAHFRTYLEKANPSSLLQSDMTLFGNGSHPRTVYNFSGLEHMWRDGVGYHNLFKANPWSRASCPWLLHPLKDVVASSLTHTDKEDKELREQHRQKLMLVVNAQGGALLTSSIDQSSPSVAQSLLAYSLKLDFPDVSRALIESGKLGLADCGAIPPRIVNQLVSAVLVGAEPSLVKRALIEIKQLKGHMVAKYVIVSDRFDIATKKDILGGVEVWRPQDKIKVAQCACRHAPSSEVVEFVLEKFPSLDPPEIGKLLASGNKLDLLLARYKADVDFDATVIAFAKSHHSEAAVKFVEAVDADNTKLVALCMKSAPKMSEYDFPEAKHDLLYLACLSPNPCFFAKCLSALAPTMTTDIYKSAAFAVLATTRPEAVVDYLKVLADARSKNEELQGFTVREDLGTIGGREGGEGGSDDDDYDEGGMEMTIPHKMVALFGCVPSYPTPDDRVVLLDKAGISSTLSGTKYNNGAKLLASLFRDEKPDLSYIPHLLAADCTALFHAGARRPDVKQAVIKVLIENNDTDKATTYGTALLKAMTNANKPSMYFDFIQPCNLKPDEDDGWKYLCERAAVMQDSDFFAKMDARGWDGVAPENEEERSFRRCLPVPATSLPFLKCDDEEEQDDTPPEGDQKGGDRPLIFAILGSAKEGDSPVKAVHVRDWMTTVFEYAHKNVGGCLDIDDNCSALTVKQLQQVELCPSVSQVVSMNPYRFAKKYSSHKKLNIIPALGEEFAAKVCTGFKFSTNGSDKATLTIEHDGKWSIEVGTGCNFNGPAASDVPPFNGVQVHPADTATTDSIEAIAHLMDHLGGGRTIEGSGPHAYHRHSFEMIHTGKGLTSTPASGATDLAAQISSGKPVWTCARGLCIVADYYWPLGHDNLLYDVDPTTILGGMATSHGAQRVPCTFTLGSDKVELLHHRNKRFGVSLKVPTEADSLELVKVAYKAPMSTHPGLRATLRPLIEGKYGPALPWANLEDPKVEEE